MSMIIDWDRTPWNAAPGELWSDPPEERDTDPPEDDSLCLNGNACEHPFCPEHGEL